MHDNRQRGGSENLEGPTRGPRGKRGEIKDSILTSARKAFIASGYDGATMREIAGDAGCDPAMIPYYFGSKQKLFRECFDLPADPASQILELVLEDPATAGERIVRHALVMYEEHLTAETMLALMHALATDVVTSERFRSYIRSDVLDKVAQTLGADPSAAERVELTMAQMYGVVAMRYLVRLEPLASMPRESLVEQLGPTVQASIDTMISAAQSHRAGDNEPSR